MPAKKMNMAPLLFLLVYFLCCTENPIGEDEIAAGKRHIRGQVRLSNNLSPEEVYVWLEGFNIATRTDAEGRFEFTLPVNSSYGNSGGIDGAFNLYYFLANFNLATTEVLVRNGEFLYGYGEINSLGELNQPKFLSRRLEVETKVRPESASITLLQASSALLRIDVILQAINDSVVVYFPGIVGDTRGPLLFRNTQTNETFIRRSRIAAFVPHEVDTIDSSPAFRTMVVELTPDLLPPAEYEVIPYLLVQDSEVPPQLIESLGNRVETLSPEYLSLPMKREGSRFFTMRP